MTGADIGQLAQTTLSAPRQAARQIIAMELPRDVLWTALALVAAINTIVLQLLISISPPEAQSQFPSYFNAPLAVYILLAGIMVLYVHSVYWAGTAMGGQGRLFDVLALIIWLQILRTCAQFVVVVLTVVAPSLAALLSLVVFALAFWILLNFVTEAMALPSLGHTFLALLMAVIGLVLGLGILLAVLGLAAQGTFNNV